MADYPFTLTDPAVAARLALVVDPEGKIERALDAVAGLAGRDVLVVGPARGRRPARLRAMGANVMTAPLSRLPALASGSVDAVIACWTALDRPTPAAERGHAAGARLLRPGGRLVLLTDYGRDDVAGLLSDAIPTVQPDRTRGRDTWFAARGFKLHVVHAWWRFESVESAAELLVAAFGERGRAVADGMRRPRLAHKLVVYHRTFDAGGAP